MKYLTAFLPGLCLLAALAAPTEARAQSDCAGGVIADDGTAENGDLLTTATSTFVQKFTPSAYPFEYQDVCACWRSDTQGFVDFDMVFYDDDGTDGQPGTELFRRAVSGSLGVDEGNGFPFQIISGELFVPQLASGRQPGLRRVDL